MDPIMDPIWYPSPYRGTPSPLMATPLSLMHTICVSICTPLRPGWYGGYMMVHMVLHDGMHVPLMGCYTLLYSPHIG